MSDQDPVTLLLLGREHPGLGSFALESVPSGRVACALSAGRDPLSSARFSKGRHDVPNEDGVLALDTGARSLLAVADAHFGHESSEALLAALARHAAVPESLFALQELLPALAAPAATPDDEHTSESTLLVAVLEHASGAVWGVSYGDSSAWLLEARGAVRPLVTPTHRYVHAQDAASLDPRRGTTFFCELAAGDALLVHSDGVDECCYRAPERSIGARHLEALLRELGTSPRDYVARLTELALHGVDGQPGGQDNVAIAMCRLEV